MDMPHTCVRLNIHPGEWYVGARYGSVYTVLGSCVSLTAWHPKLKLGGMCHFILPILPHGVKDKKTNAGRYGDSALELMKKALLAHAPLYEFQLGVYGGSDTISHFDVGKKNSAIARQWLASENLKAIHIDTGGTLSRSLILTLSTGVVGVKHHHMPLANIVPISISAKRF